MSPPEVQLSTSSAGWVLGAVGQPNQRSKAVLPGFGDGMLPITEAPSEVTNVPAASLLRNCRGVTTERSVDTSTHGAMAPESRQLQELDRDPVGIVGVEGPHPGVDRDDVRRDGGARVAPCPISRLVNVVDEEAQV
jgi:hypothetical protein